MLSIPNPITLVRLKSPEIAVRFGDDPAALTRVVIQDTRLAVRIVQALTIQGGTGNERVLCTLAAGTGINVNRVLALRSDGTVEHADKDTPAHCGQVIGFSQNSSVIGGNVTVVKSGLLKAATLGAIGTEFVPGNNGQLITTQPASGFLLHVGLQLTSVDFLVKIDEPIQI